MIEIIPTVELEDFVKPSKQNNGDAAFDVVATSREWHPNYIEYGLGFRTEIPKGLKGVIVPRSSISKYDLIMCNSPAQIDSGFKYEWKVRFKHLTEKDFNLSSKAQEDLLDKENIYKVGDRIAQIYFEYVIDLDVSNVEEKKEERSGGFGSTGN